MGSKSCQRLLCISVSSYARLHQKGASQSKKTLCTPICVLVLPCVGHLWLTPLSICPKFEHLLFGIFHCNPKTAGPHRYVLEIFCGDGGN